MSTRQQDACSCSQREIAILADQTPTTGARERFIGFLIEHCAGNFPLWLAPHQVPIITMSHAQELKAGSTPHLGR